MSIQIREIKTKKELTSFIKFPINLYRGNEFYVPPLISFELSTLDKTKNPAFENATAAYWVAEENGAIVGRIAAIAIEQEIQKELLGRFGWIDFVDDQEVSKALLDTAMKWLSEKGAKAIHGPLGFTDLDFEGALTQGFDKLATQATIYNHPYYIDHFESLGFAPAATWVELRGKVPPTVPERMTRAISMVKKRYNLKVKEFKNAKEILKYAPGVFDILNEAYSSLYGYHPLTQKQIDYYVDLYFGFVRKEFVCVVVNEKDHVVGFGLTLPSLSRAFQKAKGSLYPFGFLHVLKAFYFNEHADMFLIGIKPEYQKTGAHALIFENLNQVYLKNNVKYVASGPMLENNDNVLNIWSQFDLNVGEIKRSVFRKEIS